MMQRRAEDEAVEEWDEEDHTPLALDLANRLSEWTKTIEGVGRDKPSLPGIINRDGQLWKPLIAIADRAGTEWGERARVGAVGFLNRSGMYEEEEGGHRELVLGDIKAFFDSTELEKVDSIALIHYLKELESRPWEYLTPYKLAKLLKDFEIKPKDVKIGTKSYSGYYRYQFSNAWKRYYRAPSTSASLLPLYTSTLEKIPDSPTGEGLTPVIPDKPDISDDIKARILAFQEKRARELADLEASQKRQRELRASSALDVTQGA
jgi:hypothetical protein